MRSFVQSTTVISGWSILAAIVSFILSLITALNCMSYNQYTKQNVCVVFSKRKKAPANQKKRQAPQTKIFPFQEIGPNLDKQSSSWWLWTNNFYQFRFDSFTRSRAMALPWCKDIDGVGSVHGLQACQMLFKRLRVLGKHPKKSASHCFRKCKSLLIGADEW